MIVYIWNRIHALRKSNVVDFMTEYMKKSGAELENMRNDSSSMIHYAKQRKNISSSEVKQGIQRPKEKRQ